MNTLTGLFSCFCFGYGLTAGQPWLVIVAAILGYFVAMAAGGMENEN